MTTDQMPPLPSPTFLGHAANDYTAADMHNYARAYAEQQTAELRALLERCLNAWAGIGPPIVLDEIRAALKQVNK